MRVYFYIFFLFFFFFLLRPITLTTNMITSFIESLEIISINAPTLFTFNIIFNI